MYCTDCTIPSILPHLLPFIPPTPTTAMTIPPPAPTHPTPTVTPATHPRPTFSPDVNADLPGYTPTTADHLLKSVYQDHVHDNDSTHLSGDIDDDMWQHHWLGMVQLSSTRYQAPPGKIGRCFLTIFTRELRGVRDCRWNSERPLLFVATILQTTPRVRHSKDI